MAHAVLAYLAELEKPYHGHHGLCTICKDFEQLYYKEKGVCIPLSFATLGQLAEGDRNWEEANEHRHWLTPIKEDIIVKLPLR